MLIAGVLAAGYIMDAFLFPTVPLSVRDARNLGYTHRASVYGVDGYARLSLDEGETVFRAGSLVGRMWVACRVWYSGRMPILILRRL